MYVEPATTDAAGEPEITGAAFGAVSPGELLGGGADPSSSGTQAARAAAVATSRNAERQFDFSIDHLQPET
jgi:hypothetical protein